MNGGGDADRISVFSGCLPGWSPREVIEVAVSLGFSKVEWASGRGQAIDRPQAGSEVRELCECAGVHSVGVSVQDPEITFATPESAADHVALAIALGAPQVRLHAPPYQGGLLHREQQRARAGVDYLVDAAASVGIAVLVETSPATLAPGPDLAAALVEHHPPQRVGVLYDPGNMAIEGYVAPALAIGRLGDYLRHVHVKNIAWSRRGTKWRWRHATLATGILDWRAIVQRLAAAQYGGLFSIDHLGGDVSAAQLGSESAFLRALVTEKLTPVDSPTTPAAAGGGHT
jgi:sugar phosphate isomerase/epimerase